MANAVLDSSALLAYLNGEAGAEQVAPQIADAVISAVNFAEVVAKLVLRSGSLDRTLAALAEMELAVVDFDRSLAEAAGGLAPLTRARGLSLGDRACLALALRERAPAITADHAWSALDLGIDIRLIRSRENDAR